eukprot:8826662-Alexandrium_andersonii.AAC.1
MRARSPRPRPWSDQRRRTSPSQGSLGGRPRRARTAGCCASLPAHKRRGRLKTLINRRVAKHW